MAEYDFLRGVHDTLQPATYLEIGVAAGFSLALSRAVSIGVDPEFSIKAELAGDITLARTTSDEFFSRQDALAPFGGHPIDLAMIDGMHLFEYALRDFINVERRADWATVILFDDILPRNAEEARRERLRGAWTGDIFKIIDVLSQYRPDLICLQVATRPTGTLIVLGADPSDTTLADNYDQIVADRMSPDDSYSVPEDLLARRGAILPQDVLDAPFWSILREGRAALSPREEALPALRVALEEWARARVQPEQPVVQ